MLMGDFYSLAELVRWTKERHIMGLYTDKELEAAIAAATAPLNEKVEQLTAYIDLTEPETAGHTWSGHTWSGHTWSGPFATDPNAVVDPNAPEPADDTPDVMTPDANCDWTEPCPGCGMPMQWMGHTWSGPGGMINEMECDTCPDCGFNGHTWSGHTWSGHTWSGHTWSGKCATKKGHTWSGPKMMPKMMMPQMPYGHTWSGDEIAQLIAKYEERVAVVNEIASFPAEYITEHSARWTAMTDEAFVEEVEGWKILASKVEPTTTERTVEPMTASQESDLEAVRSILNRAAHVD